MDLTGDIVAFLIGTVSEWPDASFTSADISGGPGIKVHPLEFKFAPSLSKLNGAVGVWIRDAKTACSGRAPIMQD